MHLPYSIFYDSEESEGESDGIDTTAVCQTSYSSSGEPWTIVKLKKSQQDVEEEDFEESTEDAEEENSSQTTEDLTQGLLIIRTIFLDRCKTIFYGFYFLMLLLIQDAESF